MQGDTVKPTEQNTKTPFAAAGFVALLGGLLRASGSGARSALLLAVVALVCLVFSSAPARAAVVHDYLCQITGAGNASASSTECSKSSPGVPAGALGDVNGVAVNGAGGVFVSDSTHKVVDAFDSPGNFTGMQIAGAGATGSGKTTAGSTVIESGLTGGGFVVGEEISAPGVPGLFPAGTTIVKVEPGGVLEVSQAATKTEVSAQLQASQPFGDPFGLAAGPSSDLWVLDSGRALVSQFIAAGVFTGVQASGEGHWAGSEQRFTHGIAFSTKSDQLYVASVNAHVFVFNANGSFSSEINGAGSGIGEPYVAADNSSAVTNGDIYVSHGQNSVTHSGTVTRVDGAGGPAPFAGSAPYISGDQLTGTPGGVFGGIVGVAVDSVGHLYVDTGGVIDEFNSEGVFLGQVAPVASSGPFGGGGGGLAVNGAGDVYVAGEKLVDEFGPDLVIPDVTSTPATEVEPHRATLNGTVNPLETETGEPAECQFLWGTSVALGETQPCPAEVKGNTPVAVHAELNNKLQPDTTYYYRLQALNKKGVNRGEQSPIQQFTTSGPRIESESVSELTSTTGKLNATIVPHKASTTYHFEYDTVAYEAGAPHGTSVPVPDLAIGSGEAPIEVAPQFIAGLTPGTVYHYRVVAVSEIVPGKIEDFAGNDATFTTQGSSTTSALPDGRAYEQVSPPDKHGALFERIEHGILGPVGGFEVGLGLPMQASVAGNALATELLSPSEAEPQAFSNFVPLLSTRGSAGWSSQVIAPPHAQPVGPSGNSTAGGDGEYRLFSGDLSQVIAQPLGATLLSPRASEPTAYLRTDFFNGNVSERCEGSYLTASSCFTPLVSAREGYANVPAGTAPFGEASEGRCRSAGVEHLETYTCGPRFLDATPDLSHVVLSAGVQLTATPDEPSPASNGSLYEWGGGRLQPLYLLPAGEGGTGVYAGGFNSNRSVSHQLSNNGSVLFNYKGHLYLHDFAREDATRLVPQEGAAEFLYASTDGAKVLFRDSEQLTGAAGGGVYECRIVQDACGELLLTPLSVAGKLLGGSQDASYVYFVGAGDRLTAGHYENGSWITTAGPVLPVQGNPAEVLVSHRISPNGRWFAFNSSADLTGYDTADASSGQPDLEVYLYDAATGRTSCASCNPTGARPGGVNVTPGAGQSPDWVTAGVPEWATASNGPEGAEGGGNVTVYQPRYLSNSGRLFFDSNDALVPQDVNGTWDVYQYEPEGVPSGVHACSSSSTTGGDVFEPAHSFEVEGRKGESGAGCVALISSGTSPEESSFIDASESGGDVFFLTEAQLSPTTDTDTAPDVYDAHECTNESPCIPPPAAQPPPCETEAACKAAPTPQPSIYQAPPSATFNGPGNVTPEVAPPPKKVTTKTVKCKKGFTKKRNKCVKNKKSKRAKKASHNGRTRR
jgi:hypothetical protein